MDHTVHSRNVSRDPYPVGHIITYRINIQSALQLHHNCTAKQARLVCKEYDDDISKAYDLKNDRPLATEMAAALYNKWAQDNAQVTL